MSIGGKQNMEYTYNVNYLSSKKKKKKILTQVTT